MTFTSLIQRLASVLGAVAPLSMSEEKSNSAEHMVKSENNANSCDNLAEFAALTAAKPLSTQA
jgi:hypothetical protein